MSKRKSVIYQSRLHALITLLVLIIPAIFFFFFAHYAHISTGTLVQDLGISFFRLLVSYLVAVVLAWVCAVLFYRGKRSIIALPIFDVLQSFPTFAALPLATLAWGKSNTTVIFFLIITVIWPIFFSIISSLKLIKRDWQEAVEMSGLSGWKYIRDYLFPVTLPGIITGSIIGLGEGWEALIATEIIVGMQTGLGPFFQLYSNNPRVTTLGIVGFLLLIFTINKLVWLPLLEWSHERTEE